LMRLVPLTFEKWFTIRKKSDRMGPEINKVVLSEK